MTYFFETYGCEMNIAESASVEQLLLVRGWEKAPSAFTADMVIINTCSVRATAETRIFGRLGFYSGLKKVRNAEPYAKTKSLEEAALYVQQEGRPVPLTLVVMGCMAERLLKTLQKDFPFIDYVVGTYAKSRFSAIIQAVENGSKADLREEEPIYTFAPSSYEEGAFSTFVPIMNGCNNFCTYCIVPYVRGREVSRSLDAILHEIDLLSSYGVKEITLLGQNVNSYRSTDKNGTPIDFPLLLERISEQLEKKSSSIRWIRFESSHPKDVSDRLIEQIAKNPYICKGIHLPVQHGSSRILTRMNRRYTREHYLELTQKMKAAIPDLRLTTDVMLGFPGETEEDFLQVLSLMQEVRYQSAFMYYFNPREGTPACTMEGQIPLEVKKERLQKVIDMQLALTADVMKERIGKTVTVLADIVSRDNKAELLGKTSQNERVAFCAPKEKRGTFVNVRLEALNGNTFKGTLQEPTADER